MARNISKMSRSPAPKTMNVAFWGKKNPVKKAREDPNLKIGDKIPSAANRARELKELEERLR